MLQRLEVKNFLALRDVSLDLEPFTVLVGANASGKTTILEALHRVCALKSGRYRVLVEGGDFPERLDAMHNLISPDVVLNASGGTKIEFVIFESQIWRLILTKERPENLATSWDIQLNTDGHKVPYNSQPFGNFFEGHRIVGQLPTSSMIQANFLSLSKPSHSPLKIPFLERNGAGLGTVCQYLQQELPDTFSRVQEYLASIIRGLKRFRIRRADGTKQNLVNVESENYRDWHGIAEELIFDFDDAVGVPAKYVSEGTLLVLCILVAAARFEGEALILIDDLERGLHPKAVRDLIGALRKLQEINPKLQIVATSHSPYILSELKPQEVRVVARDPELGTVVGRLTDHPDFAKWSEVMDVGEFWSHVGEDWLLKRKEYA